MRLIVHIGGPKCGSTALQVYLRRNYDALRTNGIFAPSRDYAPDPVRGRSHARYFENLLHDPNGSVILREQLRKYRAIMETDGLDTLVLSGENLCNRGHHRTFQHAGELFDCRIVLYVRRQDDLFASGWKQWGLKQFTTPQEFIDHRMQRGAGDWTARLIPWENAFGVKNITVRNYQRSALHHGDIVDDFCTTLSLSQEGCEPLPGDINISVGDTLAGIANRIRDVFKSEHDNDFYRVMGLLIGKPAYLDHSPSAFLTNEQRRAIREHFRESNEALRRKYFSELPEDEPLFETSYPTDERPDPFEQLHRENDLLARAIYALARQSEKP